MALRSAALDESLTALVCDGLSSEHSKRAYSRAIADFLAWRDGRPFTKATVQAYRALLQTERKLAPSSINVRMSALRKLAVEASDNGLLAAELASGVEKVKGVSSRGVRAGNWLTKSQAEALLDLPHAATLKGKRDRALLALLIGCGLRRTEVAALTVEKIQQREGRWVIVDMEGKGQRVRTVPVPGWVKVRLNAWAEAAGISEGPLLRGFRKGNHLRADGRALGTQAVFYTVQGYAAQLGLALAPHDLRRTCAKLCRAAAGDLEQIQMLLGHASIQTTERYLGTRHNLVDAPNDHLGLKVTE